MLHFIYTTITNEAAAKTLARQLLDEKHIACANIMAPHVALYTYQGAFCEETETVLLCKTTENKLAGALQAMAQYHPYETPCITSWPMAQTAPAFLHWAHMATASM